MINITISDKQYVLSSQGMTIKDFIDRFYPELLDIAVACCINNKLVDLSYILGNVKNIEIISVNDTEGISVIRHSCAHLLAHAVCELFPSAEPTVGPCIEDGFYHDFYFSDGNTINNLEKIENKMIQLIKEDHSITHFFMPRDEAIKYFQKLGHLHKVSMIKEISDEKISFYQQGNFINMCRGPHVPSTKYLQSFKLIKLSGAYWKGDAQNDSLQRIYGTAWNNEQELRKYLLHLERAKISDHRLIGKKMDLFHFQEQAPGMIFWHPKGWTIFTIIQQYLRKKLIQYGYQEISSPAILDCSLWKESGHWSKYRDSMFTTEFGNRIFALKPMNCPGHIQVFKQKLRSYRELPIRFAEFGCCHRDEVTGSLHGMMRLREFVQDDGHIFCTEEQLSTESLLYIQQLINVYKDFGFNNVKVKLSTRPTIRIGEDSLWDKAEKSLTYVLNEFNIPWSISPGEGAFYGPKIEFSLQDSMNRMWQCGTLQVDFFMPKRLGAYFIDEESNKKNPVMIHRAMLGSIERFIGILLEDNSGILPIWLAPIQAVVVNITDEQSEYVKKITAEFVNYGYRVISDIRNEKMGMKIREHTISKIPFIFIIGKKEMETNTIMVRQNIYNDKEKLLGTMQISNIISDLFKY